VICFVPYNQIIGHNDIFVKGVGKLPIDRQGATVTAASYEAMVKRYKKSLQVC